jgi:inner membrane protein
MDNLTHTLTGIAIGQAGLKRKTRFAMWALIIGSNLPDIDVVSALGGDTNFLKDHRGITHSLIGMTGLALILAGAIYAFRRKAAPAKNPPPLNFKWLFILCWVATGCHVLMDYTNQYGIRPFLPFSGRWTALDIMPIVGPYVLLFLILGLGVPFVMRLVSEEVGDKTSSNTMARNGAIFSLCGILAIWGVRGLAHRRALAMLNASDYGRELPERIGAFPSFLNPFDWNGVVETKSSYHLLGVNALGNGANALDAQRLRKVAPSAAFAAAKKTRAAKVFLNFARFPWALVIPTEEGSVVYIRDLRFASADSDRWNFVVEVDLDRSLRVLKQLFTFSRPNPF